MDARNQVQNVDVNLVVVANQKANCTKIWQTNSGKHTRCLTSDTGRTVTVLVMAWVQKMNCMNLANVVSFVVVCQEYQNKANLISNRCNLNSNHGIIR